MAKKLPLAFAAVCVLLIGCTAGPKQLARTVDDWDNQLYTESPWMDALMHFVPIIPLGKSIAWVGDSLIVNPIAFWFDDAWDSRGTAYRHYVVEDGDGEMRSLMYNDTKIMRVHD